MAELLRQCLGELRKIAWPNRHTVQTNATVVFLSVIILVIGVGALELALGKLAAAFLS